MKLENPFKLQNWKFRKFLIVILFFQISLLALFTLDKMEIEFPIIRPLIGFVYLSFVPGYLLLRILKLHKLSSIESFLYAIGLSLFVDMFVGFLMNMLYPPLGITDKPISEIPIILTMTGVVFLLCIIAYFRDRGYNDPDYIDLKDILNPQVLFLSLIPFMAIFGTYLVNYCYTNVLLMVMIIIIALTALVIGFTNWIDKKYYPYAIWVIAVALIYHVVLIGDYLKIYDNQGYIPQLAIEMGKYSFTKYAGTSFTILTYPIFIPMTLFVTKLNMVTAYKYVFPIYQSFIPLFIYFFVVRYLKIHLNEKDAFFSAFLYVILPAFFTFPMVVLAKQILAIFLLAVFFNILISASIKTSTKFILLIIISITLIWIHYGTSILLFNTLIWTTMLLLPISYFKNNNYDYSIIPKITLIYGIFYISWYMYVSHASVMEIILKLIMSIIDLIIYGNFDTTTSAGVVGVTSIYGPWNLLQKIIFMYLSGCAGIGTLYLFKRAFDGNSLSLENIYSIVSLFWMVLFAAMFLPNMGIMGMGRTYLVAYAIIAPCVIIGFKYISKIINMWNLKLGYIILVSYLFITTGFINEITHINPHSIALSQNSIKNSDNIDSKGNYYSKIIYGCDVYGSKWASKYFDEKKYIYEAGCGNILIEYGGFSKDRINKLLLTNIKVDNNSYVYFGLMNTKGIWACIDKSQNKMIYKNITNTKFYGLLCKYNKIYNNNGVVIYLS